jgi:DNA-binding NarL/FixJ family response regulator
MCGGCEDAEGPPPDPCGETDHGRRVDVKDALAPMSEFDRAVARGLAEGHSRFAIARKLGCSWNTVERAVARLRECLAGLDPQEGGRQ